MLVKELIALLEKQDRNQRVLLVTYGDELYEEVGSIRTLPVDGSVCIEPKAR
jgi:hypothetical protein